MKLVNILNEAKITLKINFYKNYNQSKPDKSISVRVSDDISLSKYLQSPEFYKFKLQYDYIEVFHNRNFLGSIMKQDNWKFSKGDKLSNSPIKEGRPRKEPHKVYHKTFTAAADTAREMVEKRGYEIDEDDWQTQVAFGGRYTRSRPSVGKTHRFTIGLTKNGKPQRKSLSFQVYGMKNGYELNAYIS